MEKNKKKSQLPLIIVLVVAVLAVIGAAACLLPGNRGSAPKSSGLLSPNGICLSADGKYAYISDETAKSVYKLALSGERIEKTYRSDRPVNAIALENGVVFALEGGIDGRVVRLNGNLSKKGEVDVGHTPSGMAVLNGRGYVANRFSDTVSVIDLDKMEQIAQIPLEGRQPLSAVAAGGKIYVGCFLPDEAMSGEIASAKICVIDPASNQVTKTLPIINGAGSVRGLCALPDGSAVYLAHIVARYAYPTTQLDAGWVNTNAITWLDTATDSIVATALLDGLNEGAANPWGLAVGEDGKTLYVALAGAQELMTVDLEGFSQRVDAVRRGEGLVGTVEEIADYLPFLDGLRQRYQLPGKGPRALAVHDSTAYLCQYFSGDLAVVEPSAQEPAKTVSLGEQPEASDARYGQQLWFDASFCYQKWQSCSSCHPDGRPDGFSWDESSDGMGNTKSTKSLLYSHRTPPVLATGLQATAEESVRGGMKTTHYYLLDENGMSAIDAYLKSLTPEPSPYLNRDGTLTESALRGKALFESEGCVQCHPAPLYTDMKLHQVDTKTSESWEDMPYDTPTLVEVWRTAPYLHDGGVKTIEEVVRLFAPGLAEDAVNDLANFVRTIGKEGEAYGVEQVLFATDGQNHINKLVPGSTIEQLSIRMQEKDAPEAKAVVELLRGDGSAVFREEYPLQGLGYLQEYVIKPEVPLTIPEDLEENACLRISITGMDGGKIATDFELKD